MLLDLGLLVLRLGFGGLLLFAHGWGKVAGFSEMVSKFPDPIGLGPSLTLGFAIFFEVICAAAVALGWFTRYAALGICIMMVTIIFTVHANDPWHNKEFPLLYAIAFGALALTGPGGLSLDLFKRRVR